MSYVITITIDKVDNYEELKKEVDEIQLNSGHIYDVHIERDPENEI